MGIGKQAKILHPHAEAALLRHVTRETVHHPARNRVMVLLSLKAGLRAKEISLLTWGMVTDPDGQIADCIALENKATKRRSGRTIPMNDDLRDALQVLRNERHRAGGPNGPARLLAQPRMSVIYSERGGSMSPNGVVCWFSRIYLELGMQGCSSHSGRRTFITRAAKKIVEAGGSIRDVQQLAGHVSLLDTQAYIEGDAVAKRKVVNML